MTRSEKDIRADFNIRRAPARPLVVERAPLATRRYRASPDDLAELEAIWRALRDIPREHLATREDMINYMHRCAGRIPAVLKRLEPVAAAPKRTPRTRLAPRPAADHAAIIAGVFGGPQAARGLPCSGSLAKETAPRPARACTRTREVVSRRGKRVRVVERSAGQLELVL